MLEDVQLSLGIVVKKYRMPRLEDNRENRARIQFKCQELLDLNHELCPPTASFFAELWKLAQTACEQEDMVLGEAYNIRSSTIRVFR